MIGLFVVIVVIVFAYVMITRNKKSDKETASSKAKLIAIAKAQEAAEAAAEADAIARAEAAAEAAEIARARAEAEAQAIAIAEAAEAEKATVVVNPVEEPVAKGDQMCVYLDRWEDCSTDCGTGVQYRTQVMYNEGDDLRALYGLESVTPHKCVPPDQRQSRPCTRDMCNDTYKYSVYLANNPGKGYSDYCNWIVENNACKDRFVVVNSACTTQCSAAASA